MKSFIVFALFVAAAVAAPVDQNSQPQIIHQENDNMGVEGFNFGYDTSNGIKAEEQGQLENPGSGNAPVVGGQFSYTGPDGVVYTVTYNAPDENEFQPQDAAPPHVATDIVTD